LESIIKALLINSDLSKHYSFIFIGSNFEKYTHDLNQSGYNAAHHKWVDNFSEILSTCDIQIFPITVGTGTKNKVLHAIATGLLGIGTNVAFENILVKNDKDCLYFEDIDNLIDLLKVIPLNRNHYAEIAKSGSIAIRNHHNPKVTSMAFWDNILQSHTIK
jgi:hypothetical protein